MHPQLRPFQQEDLDAAARLVGRAMDAAEEACARASFAEHFALRGQGLSDGRELHVLTLDGALIGIAGLHFYSWGPPQNVWLSWFALAPEHRGQGLGSLLLRRMMELAKEQGYLRLYIETYSSPAFATARTFYSHHGFVPVGVVADYLPDGASMVVYCRSLA